MATIHKKRKHKTGSLRTPLAGNEKNVELPAKPHAEVDSKDAANSFPYPGNSGQSGAPASRKPSSKNQEQARYLLHYEQNRG